MSLSYRIDEGMSLIRIEADGRLTASEMDAIATAMVADPSFRPGMDVLSDSRRVTYAPSTDDVRVMSQLVERVRKAGVGRVAVVTTSAVMFGMMRMLSAIAGLRGHEVEVFNRVEEALAWLADRQKPSP